MKIDRNKIRSCIKTNPIIKCDLGEISILKELGEGGNGLVFYGNLSGIDLAIKFLTEPEGDKIDRFLAEYINVVTLEKTKNLVKYISFDNIEIADYKLFAIIMKKYENSLNRDKGVPTFESIANLFNFLLETCKYIHKEKIIHRDIKPQNVLIDKNNNFILTDFGIANYNPDIFKIKAKTKKGDRLGNYQFSAPEQAEGKSEPHITMDIYAIGQICQWYVTGKVHKGSNRETIINYYENNFVRTIDNIIEICISNNPKDRFQSIFEIEEYIKNSSKKSCWEYLRTFGRIVSSIFPKGLHKINSTENQALIEDLFQKFEKSNFDNVLIWLSNLGDCPAKFKKVKDCWLLDNFEIKVSRVWAYFGLEYYADLLIIETKSMPSFGIYNTRSSFEEAALIDDTYYVTRQEYDNGFAQIDENTIYDLFEHKSELRIRLLNESFFLIGTRYHCFYQYQNQKYNNELFKQLKNGKNFDEVLIDEYISKVRRIIHEEVKIGL